MLVLSGQEQGRPHSCICKIRIALLRCLMLHQPMGLFTCWPIAWMIRPGRSTISFPHHQLSSLPPFSVSFWYKEETCRKGCDQDRNTKKKKKKKSPMLRKGGRYQTTFSADPAFHRKPFHRMSLSHSYVVGHASGLNCCPKNWLWHLVLPQPQCYSDEISGNIIEDTQRMPH